MPEAFRSYSTRLTTTGATFIATGVTGTTGVTGVTLVRGVNVANIDATNNAAISVHIHQGATGYALVSGYTVATGTRYQVLDAPLALRQGDTLKATASAADRLEVVVSALEIT